jgi:hypothetical protein
MVIAIECSWVLILSGAARTFEHGARRLACNMSAWKASVSEICAVRHPELFFVSLASGDYSHEAAHAIAE